MKNENKHPNGNSDVHAAEHTKSSEQQLKYDHPAPEGAAKSLSQVLGEIVWLMSQPKPIGVVLWADVDAEVAARLASDRPRLRPQDWKSGEHVPPAERQAWVVDVIAPFGGAEDMVRELKQKVFPSREVRYVRMDAQGKTVVVV